MYFVGYGEGKTAEALPKDIECLELEGTLRHWLKDSGFRTSKVHCTSKSQVEFSSLGIVVSELYSVPGSVHFTPHPLLSEITIEWFADESDRDQVGHTVVGISPERFNEMKEELRTALKD